MKVVHFSDWHGSTEILPSGDVYVCTGDMMPNFPLLILDGNDARGKRLTWDPISQNSPPLGSYVVGQELDPSRERRLQLRWQKSHPARKELGIPDSAHVLVVKGNHDFVPLAGWFGGNVFEITDDPTRVFTLFGLRWGGCRGVDIIGCWADELRLEEFYDRAMGIPPDIDVLLTHTPPAGILSNQWGSPAVASYVSKRMLTDGGLQAHLFGHVHEKYGVETRGGTLFSNAATHVNVVDL